MITKWSQMITKWWKLLKNYYLKRKKRKNKEGVVGVFFWFCFLFLPWQQPSVDETNLLLLRHATPCTSWTGSKNGTERFRWFFPWRHFKNPFGSPPSLSFMDIIFKYRPSHMRVCIRRVSSGDLTFGRLEKAPMACLEEVWVKSGPSPRVSVNFSLATPCQNQH